MHGLIFETSVWLLAESTRLFTLHYGITSVLKVRRWLNPKITINLIIWLPRQHLQRYKGIIQTHTPWALTLSPQRRWPIVLSTRSLRTDPWKSKIPLKEHIPRLHPLHLGYVVYTVQDILTQSTKSSFSDLPNSIQQHIMRPAVEICKTAWIMPSLPPASPYAPTMHNAQQVNCRCFYTICLVFNFSYCLTINSFNPTNIAYRYAVKLESRLMFSRVIQGPQCVKSHVGAFECTRRSCRTKDFIT